MEPMRIQRLLIVSAALLLAGCNIYAPSPPAEHLDPAPTDATGTVSVNDQMPKTTDSLEVAASSAPAMSVSGSLTTNFTILFGNPDAKVRLTEYFDYDCRYCREFALHDQLWIEENYIATGKLALERVFVPMTQVGARMDQAALCAAEQKKFDLMDESLLLKPLTTNKAILDAAKAMKLEMKSFTACMQRKDMVKDSEKVTRVPAFKIGDSEWVGIESREELEAKILKILP